MVEHEEAGICPASLPLKDNIGEKPLSNTINHFQIEGRNGIHLCLVIAKLPYILRDSNAVLDYFLVQLHVAG